MREPGALGYMVASRDLNGVPPPFAGLVSIAAVLAPIPRGSLTARLGAAGRAVSRRRLEHCFADYLIVLCRQFSLGLAIT
jgi:hypothetical protein